MRKQKNRIYLAILALLSMPSLCFGQAFTSPGIPEDLGETAPSSLSSPPTFSPAFEEKDSPQEESSWVLIGNFATRNNQNNKPSNSQNYIKWDTNIDISKGINNHDTYTGQNGLCSSPTSSCSSQTPGGIKGTIKEIAKEILPVIGEAIITATPIGRIKTVGKVAIKGIEKGIDLAKNAGKASQAERVVNTLERSQSPIWRNFNNFRDGIKTNGRKGSKLEYYEWDYTHKDIEVYGHNKLHKGSMDPVTGKMTKPAEPGRTLEL